MIPIMPDDNVSIRTSNQSWSLQIVNNLNRLEEFERVARCGATDFNQELQLQQAGINPVVMQYKSFQLFMTEIKLFLVNISKFGNSEVIQLMVAKINEIELAEAKEKFISASIDDVSRKNVFVLSNRYYEALNIISEIRALAIESVWKLLSPNPQDNTGRL